MKVLLDNVTSTDNSHLKIATLTAIGYICESIVSQIQIKQNRKNLLNRVSIVLYISIDDVDGRPLETTRPAREQAAHRRGAADQPRPALAAASLRRQDTDLLRATGCTPRWTTWSVPARRARLCARDTAWR